VTFVDELEESSPSEEALLATKDVISRYKVDYKNIIGHSEVNTKTICPGNKFSEWKKLLV